MKKTVCGMTNTQGKARVGAVGLRFHRNPGSLISLTPPFSSSVAHRSRGCSPLETVLHTHRPSGSKFRTRRVLRFSCFEDWIPGTGNDCCAAILPFKEGRIATTSRNIVCPRTKQNTKSRTTPRAWGPCASKASRNIVSLGKRCPRIGPPTQAHIFKVITPRWRKMRNDRCPQGPSVNYNRDRIPNGFVFREMRRFVFAGRRHCCQWQRCNMSLKTIAPALRSSVPRLAVQSELSSSFITGWRRSLEDLKRRNDVSADKERFRSIRQD
ncbi:uncharacterized protein K452DRAFT_127136 [Aplosporella prunicola CBS 121167]|uniref:Uncharacterized protein n=1 Tax=Aplosporella prunicola CBS 121167 TaxID=1176127 RepID=A0A6A6AZH6_9PEZI|nr:uncharacterized protein K452DRAFT_127136 [Aplosporella prunicola CBS 121167]KAF2136668.1 hypothetical protein K452DRAFT_127136 [Aplosporella prunicola CBS 121167]